MVATQLSALTDDFFFFAQPKIITVWFVKVVFCDTVSVKAAHPPRTPTAATGDSRGVGYFSIVVLNNNGTPRMMLLFFVLNSKHWLWKQPTVCLTRSFPLKMIYSCSFRFSSLSHGTDTGHCLTPPRQLTLTYGQAYTNRQPCGLSCAFSRCFYSTPPSRLQHSDLIILNVYRRLPQPRASGEICLLPLSVMSCQCTAS